MKNIMFYMSVTIALIIGIGKPQAQAQQLTYDFQGTFNSGSLIGQTFHGTFSYAIITTGSGRMFQSTTSTLTIGMTTLTQSAIFGIGGPATVSLNLTSNGIIPPFWILDFTYPSLSPQPFLDAPIPLNTATSVCLYYYGAYDDSSSACRETDHLTVTLKSSNSTPVLVTFEDAPSVLEGVYNGIDWLNEWLVDDQPCGSCPPRLAYFNSSSEMCRDFIFVTPSILQSLSASAHGQSGWLTLRSFANDNTELESFGVASPVIVSPDACTLYATNWQKPATRVEVCFEFGWDLGIDNVLYTTPTSNTLLSTALLQTTPVNVTVAFDTPAPPGSSGDLLTGVFQGIDFGTGQWRWEGAYAADPTNHIYFHSAAGKTRTFQFASGPKIFESLRVFTDKKGTLVLSDDQGQTIPQITIKPGALTLIQTGWTKKSTKVTVNFTAGWALGIDDLVYHE